MAIERVLVTSVGRFIGSNLVLRKTTIDIKVTAW